MGVDRGSGIVKGIFTLNLECQLGILPRGFSFTGGRYNRGCGPLPMRAYALIRAALLAATGETVE